MDEPYRKIYQFDNFRLDVSERTLLKNGQPVSISPKAFDILVALLDSNNRLIERGTLFSVAWPDRIVEDANITVQISAIRKALSNPAYITTVPGHGYRFSADVTEAAANSPPIANTNSDSKAKVERGTAAQALALDPGGNGSFNGLRHLPQDAGLTTDDSKANNFRRRAFAMAVVATVLAVSAGYLLFGDRIKALARSVWNGNGQISITRLTDDGKQAAPSISPDGRLIAYVENGLVNGKGGLFVRHIDSNNSLQLMGPGFLSWGCNQFSRNGSLIYFILIDEQNPDGSLYSIPVLGGPPRRLIDGVRWCFTLSPADDRVAYFRYEDDLKRASLIVSSPDDGGQHSLFAKSFDEMRLGSFMTWSPDGASIAFTADTDVADQQEEYSLHTVSLATAEIKQISNESFAAVGNMKWTPDGEALVFIAKQQKKQNQIWLFQLSTGELRQLTNDINYHANYGLSISEKGDVLVANVSRREEELVRIDVGGDPTKWTRIKGTASASFLGLTSLPDRKLAYVSKTGDQLDIWTIREDGIDSRPLTTNQNVNGGIASSPDGSLLVYSLDTAAGRQLYRANASDGSGVLQLTFGAASAIRPNVSPDGTVILFELNDGTDSVVASVPISGGQVNPLTNFKCVAPVLSPDGTKIACVIPSSTHARRSSLAILSAKGGEPLETYPVVLFEHADYCVRWMPDSSGIVFRATDNGTPNLMVQPIDGRQPFSLTKFPDGDIPDFDFSDDGKTIYMRRARGIHDIVAIRNFR